MWASALCFESLVKPLSLTEHASGILGFFQPVPFAYGTVADELWLPLPTVPALPLSEDLSCRAPEESVIFLSVWTVLPLLICQSLRTWSTQLSSVIPSLLHSPIEVFFSKQRIWENAKRGNSYMQLVPNVHVDFISTCDAYADLKSRVVYLEFKMTRPSVSKCHFLKTSGSQRLRLLWGPERDRPYVFTTS